MVLRRNGIEFQIPIQLGFAAMKGGENIIEPSWSFLPRGAGPGRAGFVRSG
jgi:hypothetical protein